MRVKLPETGRNHEAVMADLRAMKASDADWRNGRVPLFVFKADDATERIGREAFLEYFTENALGGARAFPSVKRMEEDVVGMALDLLSAPQDARGFMTTGGTESIIQAVHTCRDWSRAERKSPGHRGNIVAPLTVHPAFDKAAKLMDLEVRRAGLLPDLTPDLDALQALIDAETIMLVGSAPSFAYGMIDPIAEIGRIAEARGLWLHVDACVGGYLAPFARMIGREIPEFDFRVPAVTSITADLHKFGFCPKPASTVFYRTADRARHHPFHFQNWPNGQFLTTTIVGTRPAGAVAGAWATMQSLGREGYMRIASELLAFVDGYKAAISAIDGLRIIGRPHLSIVAYGSGELDVFRVAEIMAAKGWVPGLLQQPKGIHRMMSLLHKPSLEAYLADLRAALDAVRSRGAGASSIEASY